jgi:periplasmic divalent cation tolerance protein
VPAAAQVCQIQVAHRDRDALQAIVDDLLERRLIACGQLLGPITSSYRWQGRRECEQEWLALLKTASVRAAAVGARVRELHSYEVPELLVAELSGADADYVRWVLEQTGASAD